MQLASDRRTRQLRNVAEVVAGTAFFVDEVQQNYAALGFRDPGFERHGLRMFDWQPYFVARAAPMGRVPGEVVAAAFGVFPLARVVDAITAGWALTDPATILEARLGGVQAALERVLGADPAGARRATELLRRGVDHADVAGRPLYGGLRSLPYPGSVLGDLWHAATLYREHRNDVHISAWTTVGLSGAQACLLNDARQGLGLKTYVRTRGWTEADLDEALRDLRRRGLVDDVGLTEAGVEFREWIEAATDAQQSPICDAIGDDLDELIALLTPLREAIMDAGAYPGRRFVEATAQERAQA
ncbi:MAG: hypothetical protein OEY23_18595 [Acidimicrobiia bacterium]|nr:hypothetical protein [Acidimicrobiia bacterium]